MVAGSLNQAIAKLYYDIHTKYNMSSRLIWERPSRKTPDAKILIIMRATLRALRYSFKEVEARLAEGEEIEIVRRNKVIAKLVPVAPVAPAEKPDFLGRMRQNWGDQMLEPSNAELLAQERERF
jgi:antitoxin (DNA-binding transcriptional repressor) of toxin-antitoxin stability system